MIPGGSDEQSWIQTVKIGKQVNLIKDEYSPLVDVKGLGCWPSEPLYDQIVEGEELKNII